MSKINIIGGGFAGCEAAFALAERGHEVTLIEQKPVKFSPAHNQEGFCELVCSNSLKSTDVYTGSGLLKAEMKLLGSLVLTVAEHCSVAAGGALAVDREQFSKEITEVIKKHKNITVQNQEVTEFPEGFTIVATGPLTEGKLYERLQELTGESLHFFDAAAPIVTAESIDYSRAFSQSRYGKGSDDYINCPMNKEEYEVFHAALISAETAVLKDFEKNEIFEGCMPIEVMAKRGKDTIRFGPMRPVGLIDPLTQHRPYANLQLRRENRESTLYNLVGFQTNLKFPEQKRVFSLIPALKNAEFIKYGVMHRNSFVNSPKSLTPFGQIKGAENIFVAGQLSGVEGYMESALSGLLTALNLHRLIEGKEMLLPPDTTMTGAILQYLRTENKNFQPMNANFGILKPLECTIKDKDMRKKAFADKAISDMEEFCRNLNC